MALAAGNNTLTFLVPARSRPGETFARFRLSTSGKLAYYGLANDGEVEDYLVKIEGETASLDFGDAPQGYPTVLSQDGARHQVVSGFVLGKLIDPETDGQPSGLSNGDDLNNADDEDGVTFVNSPIPGQTTTMQVYTLVPATTAAFLNVWIDYNADGDWADAGEHVITDQGVTNTSMTLSFLVPATAKPGDTVTRVRLSSLKGLRETGLAPDGEVEDYGVAIQEPPVTGDCIEFEDLPLGMTYTVGSSFVDSGVTMQVEPFQWSTGQWTSNGTVRVSGSQQAGHTGQDVNLNNASLRFLLGTCSELSLLYGEYGGNLNLRINGTLKNFENMSDIAGATIAGVLVTVTDLGGGKGELKLTGTLTAFSMGGQELWIDHVCPGQCSSPFVLQINRQNQAVVITWDAPGAILESSVTITGSWAPVSGAVSPYTVPNTGEAQRFYRLSKP